jgi:YggT family protein
MSPIAVLLDIYSIVVLVSILGSWMGRGNVVFQFADRLTEPVLEPIRRVLPPAGGFDLSPMLLLVGLHLLRGLFR